MKWFLKGNIINTLEKELIEMRPEIIEFPEEMPARAFVGDIAEYPYHWHNALEIIYVLQGRVYVGMEGETHLLAENDIAVINRNEMHRIYKSSGSNKLLIVQADDDFCERVSPEFQYTFFYCCSAYHEAEAPEKYNTLKAYVAQLACSLCQEPYKNQKKIVRNYLEKTLFYMINNFDYLRFGPGIKVFGKKQEARYKKVYEHICKYQGRKQSLKELADEAGISLQHMSYDISDKFGFTFQELLNYSKCASAAKLLLSTDKHISEISTECGLSDPKYLIKHFKLNYHCTPSEFRKLYRGEEEALASQVQYRELPLSFVPEYFKDFYFIVEPKNRCLSLKKKVQWI